jgi:3-oxoadipate enol-lactonase
MSSITDIDDVMENPPMSNTHPAGPAFAAAGDGTRIAYRRFGRRGSRQRILLLHSLAMDGLFWEPVADRLAGEADIVAVDCRGHGLSGKPAGPYHAAQFADDVRAVCTAIGFGPAVVAGASMGGCVALQFAASHPGPTCALGLFDTTAWYGPTAPADWRQRADKARAEGLRALVGFQSTRWFSDAFREAHPDVLARAVDTFLRNDVEAFASTCGMLGDFDGRALLADIGVPTAILVGEDDYATPVAMAQVLHGGIAGSTLDVLPGARHLTPLEHTDAVADALRGLLARSRTTQTQE